MKKRIAKKREKMIRKKIHGLLDDVLDINGIGERAQCITGSLPTAFFSFSGHIGSLDVEVFDNGWFSYAKKDFGLEPKTTLTELSKAHNYLKRRYRSGCRK